MSDLQELGGEGIALDQRFLTRVPQELLKHAIPD